MINIETPKSSFIPFRNNYSNPILRKKIKIKTDFSHLIELQWLKKNVLHLNKTKIHG